MIHIRRCHICHQTSESEESKIERCTSCGKYLAPFLFCNDPSDYNQINVNQDVESQESSPLGFYLKTEYPPIYGISLYW